MWSGSHRFIKIDFRVLGAVSRFARLFEVLLNRVLLLASIQLRIVRLVAMARASGIAVFFTVEVMV